MKSVLIQRAHLIDDDLQIVWQEVDIVADKQRRRGAARHEFHIEIFVTFVIKEDIVTLTMDAEVLHEIIDAHLNEIRQGVDISILCGDDIELAKADSRASGRR